MTLGVALCLAVNIAAAGPLEDAQIAYNNADYETALRLLMPLADQGIPDAQFNLGVLYANGQGVALNNGEAVRWYQRAAEQGYANAQYNLAIMYYN